MTVETSTLPEEEPDAEEERRPSLEGALRVLVVDDDARLIALLEDYLVGEGFSVRAIADSRVALERATTWRPDVILLDYMMPGLDGATFVNELRRLKCPSRVVLVTSSGLGPSVAEFLGVELLTKPFDLQDLKRVLEGSLTGN